MKILRGAAHLAGVLISIFLLLGVPFLASAYGQAFLSGGDTDAVSSATGVILDAPSGSYLVLINRQFHQDSAALQDWEDYFTGANPYIISFENLSCSVAEGDTGAVNMAESFQSRLPENQMAVQEINSTLLISRAECGKYDLVIMSAEFAEANHFDASAYADTLMLEITGGTE